MCLQMAFAAFLIASFLPSESAAAEEPVTISGPLTEIAATLPRGEPVILEVTLNHVKQGVYPIIISQEGDYLLRGVDLKTIGVTVPYGSRLVVGGEEYFSLSLLGATSMSLDESGLMLSADLPAERWPKQSSVFVAVRTPQLITPHDNSAFFNYRLLNTGYDSGTADTWLIGGEVGVRYSDLLFRSESVYLRQGDQRQMIRYGTSVTHDNRDTLQRLIAGDFVTSSGNLGNTLSLGGISFSKAYTIDPYFVKQPTAGFVSTIVTPSQVDIYLDGMRLRTETLQPGEFELKNLNYYGGRHDLEMVIRDAFGREQRIAYPYYFSDQNLRKGLHDYSYNFGRLRTGVGTADDNYAKWAFSGYHRVGFSDDLTLGVRGEAEAALNNFGPTAVVRLNHWGVLSGTLSRSVGDNETGWAAATGYVYQMRNFSLQGSMRRYTNDYEQVGILSGAYRPEQEITAAAGYAVKGIGNLGISARNITYYQGLDQKTVSLSYSRNLYRAFNLMTMVGRTTTSEASNYFYIMLNYFPGQSFNSSFSHHQQNSDVYSDTFQVGNNTPVGEGLGYRFTADRTVSASDESIRLSPWAQYNARHAIYTANVQNIIQPGNGAQTSYQWGVSGGIAYVADTVTFTRPITDSFALVEVGKLEGVRVYNSSQEMGRTDRSGQLFLPNVGSYLVNRISVDDRDIPIDYSLNAKELNMSPPLRSGSLMRFDVKQLQAVVGRLRLKDGNLWRAAEFAELTLEVDWRRFTVPAGRDGEFYIENLPAGSHKVYLEDQGVRCDFLLEVPESSETLIDLGEVNGCEMVR